MSGLGALGKYLDRKILVVIVLLLAAAAVVNFVLLGGARGQKADILAEYSERSDSISDLERQVGEIRQGGASDLQALATKVAGIESVLPAESDMISVTGHAAGLAGLAGVTLNDFEANSKAAEGQKLTTGSLEKGILYSTPYTFDVIGTPDAVQKFIEAAMSSDKWIASVESLTVVPKSLDNRRSETADSVFGSSVSARGVLLVWGLLEPPVAYSASTSDSSAPAVAGSGASPSGAPSPAVPVPGASSSAPADPSSTVSPSTPPVAPAATAAPPAPASTVAP